MYDEDDPDHILEAKLALLGVCVERSSYPPDAASASWAYPYFVVWLRDRNCFVFIQPQLQRHNTRRQALEKTLDAFGQGIEPYDASKGEPADDTRTLKRPRLKKPRWGADNAGDLRRQLDRLKPQWPSDK
jgi:hypothetical protein